MAKAENVIQFYVLCNKLKNVVRTGWKIWHVESGRLESIAEHIYGVQMLAIAMKSEYQYDVDLERVILMLAVHELEEIRIGDFNPFEITKEEKAKLGHEAVVQILADLAEKEKLLQLILEFDEQETNEAKFAHLCDKLEADLQCKLYDEVNPVNLNNQPGNNLLQIPEVKKFMEVESTWSSAWMKLNQQKYHYDANFREVSDYALEHEIGLNK